MTREECLAYRQRCPYDAMGDFSVFSEKKEDSRDNEVAASQPELSVPLHSVSFLYSVFR